MVHLFTRLDPEGANAQTLAAGRDPIQRMDLVPWAWGFLVTSLGLLASPISIFWAKTWSDMRRKRRRSMVRDTGTRQNEGLILRRVDYSARSQRVDD
jgi:hypothetical protein